jgi:hypothetical protein
MYSEFGCNSTDDSANCEAGTLASIAGSTEDLQVLLLAVVVLAGLDYCSRTDRTRVWEPLDRDLRGCGS